MAHVFQSMVAGQALLPVAAGCGDEELHLFSVVATEAGKRLVSAWCSAQVELARLPRRWPGAPNLKCDVWNECFAPVAMRIVKTRARVRAKGSERELETGAHTRASRAMAAGRRCCLSSKVISIGAIAQQTSRPFDRTLSSRLRGTTRHCYAPSKSESSSLSLFTTKCRIDSFILFPYTAFESPFHLRSLCTELSSEGGEGVTLDFALARADRRHARLPTFLPALPCFTMVGLCSDRCYAIASVC